MIVEETQDSLAPLTKVIVEAMHELKANKVTVLDLRNLVGRTVDEFIICDATNDRQVQAIAHNVEKVVKERLNDNAWHKEGYENKEWILLDYVNIVVHVFLDHKRDFYAIEELWGDAKITEYKDEPLLHNKSEI
ncbi:MAG: ribosome silencing factor [Bacteroidota bacterium]|nr:ribosome silencing factor [Bacteroidota bacterium]